MEYRRAAHVAWRKIDSETVVVDLKAKRIFGLNGSGGQVWHALPGHDEPATAVAGAPQTPAVASFLAHLCGLGLVIAEEADASTPEPGEAIATADALIPPQVIWNDEIRNFGVSCAHVFGQGGTCDVQPSL